MGFLMEVVKADQDSMNEVVYASENVRGAISFISAPAAKAFCEPVNMIDRMVGEVSNSFRAVLSSLMRGVQRALRALGRLSVICPTPGRGSEVSMYSYDCPAVAEKLRTTVGSVDCMLNLEAIGLKLLKTFILDQWRSNPEIL